MTDRGAPAEAWPPAPTSSRPWHERRLRSSAVGGRLVAVVVREVQLWGRVVLVDEVDSVYCGDCWRFVPVDELGRADNPHSVGLPYRAARLLLPSSWAGEGGGRGEEGF